MTSPCRGCGDVITTSTVNDSQSQRHSDKNRSILSTGRYFHVTVWYCCCSVVTYYQNSRRITWHCALAKGQTQLLETMQKRAIRIIPNFFRGMMYSKVQLTLIGSPPRAFQWA